ncbi:hypothetical protein [Clostridium saccharoperbutylacetonicum]|uniref:hypothetical protein n=1 Tax=Clostridium saccharoperbutylacetonicum TaxID=36745 RepID=UPI0039E792EF
MDFDIKDYDKIDKCIQCGDSIKLIKLDYIKKRIENISKSDLELLKICSKCKRKLFRD